MARLMEKQNPLFFFLWSRNGGDSRSSRTIDQTDGFVTVLQSLFCGLLSCKGGTSRRMFLVTLGFEALSDNARVQLWSIGGLKAARLFCTYARSYARS